MSDRPVQIRILRERCSGSRMCARRAPTLFSNDDEDKAVYTPDPDGDDERLLRSIAAACPTYAIDVRIERRGD